MFDRYFFEEILETQAGKFAEKYTVPFPRIDVVLRDGTDFWVNAIVAVHDGHTTLRQTKSPSDVIDWTVAYEEISRVTFSTVSGVALGFQQTQKA